MNVYPTPKALKNLREICKWSNADVAQITHVSEDVVQSWEKGDIPMPAAAFHLLTIFAIYKLSKTEEPTPMDIKNLRMSLGLTQKDFAELMSSSLRRVSGWEIGETYPHHGLWRAMRLFAVLEDPSTISV